MPSFKLKCFLHKLNGYIATGTYRTTHTFFISENSRLHQFHCLLLDTYAVMAKSVPAVAAQPSAIPDASTSSPATAEVQSLIAPFQTEVGRGFSEWRATQYIKISNKIYVKVASHLVEKARLLDFCFF